MLVIPQRQVVQTLKTRLNYGNRLRKTENHPRLQERQAGGLPHQAGTSATRHFRRPS